MTRTWPAYEKIGVQDKEGNYLQLSTALLQIENEFYGKIRPKCVIRSGERPLHALRERGVEYVEVRLMDLDPFAPVGITPPVCRFIDVFLLHCLLCESPPDTPDGDRRHRAQPGKSRRARPRAGPQARARLAAGGARGMGRAAHRRMRAARRRSSTPRWAATPTARRMPRPRRCSPIRRSRRRRACSRRWPRTTPTPTPPSRSPSRARSAPRSPRCRCPPRSRAALRRHGDGIARPAKAHGRARPGPLRGLAPALPVAGNAAALSQAPSKRRASSACMSRRPSAIR